MPRKCSITNLPILLVDDDPNDILIAKRAFAKAQIQNKIYVTRDGEEAIRFLQKKESYKAAPTPSIVLLDLKMPKVDGFEVLETIKSDEQLKSIPIIVLTTSERDQDIERAYNLGCNSFIVKPVSFHDFVDIVNEIKRYWQNLSKLPKLK